MCCALLYFFPQLKPMSFCLESESVANNSLPSPALGKDPLQLIFVENLLLAGLVLCLQLGLVSPAPASHTCLLAIWPLASYSTSPSFGFCICRRRMKIGPTSVRYYPYHRILGRRVSRRPSFPGSIVFFLGIVPPSL